MLPLLLSVPILAAGSDDYTALIVFILIVWILLAFFVGRLAASSGRDSVLWGLLSLATSPVLACIFLLVANTGQPVSTKRCPNCGQYIWIKAKECPFCHCAPHKTSDSMRCTNCGQFIWAQANECPYCHSNLQQQRLEAQATAPEEQQRVEQSVPNTQRVADKGGWKTVKMVKH
jgi:RNA polymerase subunit RPABC4/transcription elongation factor Spt4